MINASSTCHLTFTNDYGICVYICYLRLWLVPNNNSFLLKSKPVVFYTSFTQREHSHLILSGSPSVMHEKLSKHVRLLWRWNCGGVINKYMKKKKKICFFLLLLHFKNMDLHSWVSDNAMKVMIHSLEKSITWKQQFLTKFYLHKLMGMSETTMVDFIIATGKKKTKKLNRL